MLSIVFTIPAIILFLAIIFTYRSSATYKNGLLFAVTLPPEAMEQPHIQQIQKEFNRQFKRTWLIMIIAYTPILIFYKWFAFQTIYFLLWTCLFVIVIVLPFRKACRATLEIKKQEGWLADQEDNDQYWANGFTYHNPNDKRIMVPKRVGMGETINTGTTAGKIIMSGVAALLVVTIFGISFLLIRSELTSPSLTITLENEIEINYPMYSYSFHISEIENSALVDSIPSGVKANGEATSSYARGRFKLKELGKARLYVFKKNPPYIQMKLSDQYVFYNDKDPEVTKQLYEQIKEATNAAQ